MMGDHSSEAAELKANIAGLAQETNGLITRAAQLKQNTEEMGERIQQLTTHNLDIAHAASLLTAGMEDDFRALYNKYNLAVTILEQFAGKI